MTTAKSRQPEWMNRGKTIRQLIQELQSFEDQELELRISVDDGDTSRPISLVMKSDEACLLAFCGT